MNTLSRRVVLTILAALSIVAPLNVSQAAGDEPSQPKMRVALKGYDTVSYFTVGRPEKGSPEFSTTFDDAVYWFKSAEHRDMFAADPDRYAPQFGGFCAIALSHDFKHEPDPEAWAILDGKLYVFGAKRGMPVFAEQSAAIVEKATKNSAEQRQRP